MSKARAKGTSWEVALLKPLSAIWPKVDRAPLKGITEMKPDEAQKAIQRALGGLLEASGVSAPTSPVPPVDLEVAPKPLAVDEGK